MAAGTVFRPSCRLPAVGAGAAVHHLHLCGGTLVYWDAAYRCLGCGGMLATAARTLSSGRWTEGADFIMRRVARIAQSVDAYPDAGYDDGQFDAERYIHGADADCNGTGVYAQRKRNKIFRIWATK